MRAVPLAGFFAALHLLVAASCAGHAGSPAASGPPAPPDDEGVQVLLGRIVDGTGAAPVEDGVVILRGNRIACAGARDACPVPADARVLDAGGGTILPGLIDAHVHGRPHYLPWFLAAGVTSIRDAANTLGTAAGLEHVRPHAPRVFWTGPMLDGPDSFLAAVAPVRAAADGDLDGVVAVLLETEDDARRVVDALADRGARAVKLYERLPPEVFTAVVARARERGLPTMTDLGVQLTRGLDGATVDALAAIEAGVTSIEHASGFALAYGRLGGDLAAPDLDPVLVDRLARALVDAGTVLVPTLINQRTYAAAEPSLEPVPNAELIGEEFIGEWAATRSAITEDHLARARRDLALSRAIIARVARLGGRIAAGTDAPSPFLVPGGSLHQELELLVDAGLTPLEAIAAATGTAARLLGRDDLGVVRAGALADIVVVDGNPAADIRATRRIRHVVLDGRPLDMDSLRQVGTVAAAARRGAARSASPAAGPAAAEAATAARLERIRGSPPLLIPFLRAMPKGGDLHSHLGGAVYAENMIAWAAEDGRCIVLETLAAAAAPCDAAAGRPPATLLLEDPDLYDRVVDAWSVRNLDASRETGHARFFGSFGRFVATLAGRAGDALAEATGRAAAGNVSYLELMQTPEFTSAEIAREVGWDPDLERLRRRLVDAGLVTRAVPAARESLDATEARRREIQRCGSGAADAGCAVTVRYLYQVRRAVDPALVYAQILAGFAIAASDPRVVGLNLVQPEDQYLAMRDYSLHMRMIRHLRAHYPEVRLSLHAGELAPGLVPPERLRFHIREAVEVAGADRIGHGTSIMHEDRPFDLLRVMADRRVLVEVGLSSSDVILGIRGDDHPLRVYLEHGVPVALATDDEGVARSEMSMEFVKAVQEHGLDYPTLKRMARNSLEHAFVEGASLWADPVAFRPVGACAPDRPAAHAAAPSPRCRAFLDASTRARLQWDLESRFAAFEAEQAGVPAASDDPARGAHVPAASDDPARRANVPAAARGSPPDLSGLPSDLRLVR